MPLHKKSFLWPFLVHFLLVLNIGAGREGFLNAQTSFSATTLDIEVLNKHILFEVNQLRRKSKVPLLQNEKDLWLAADDHARYMAKNNTITHFQRDKTKKNPKNRVDFYGQQFDIVGENVQLNNLNTQSKPKNKLYPSNDTYETLAKQLVLAWKNSPPHYANMISSNFSTTYTAIVVGTNGEVYACQLFGGTKYHDKYKNLRDSIHFKPYNPKRCWRCDLRPPNGRIILRADSTLIYYYKHPRIFFDLLSRPELAHTKMRFFKPKKDGLAADIVVRSQYPCDSNSYFNGLSNFRGVPLKPVYKKDFNGGIHWRYTEIVLGKVPTFIREPFEVNLVVIQNNRPCSNTSFQVIPANFHVEIPLSYGFEPLEKPMKRQEFDTLKTKIFFDKAKFIRRDSALIHSMPQILMESEQIQHIEIKGYASIEGTTESNINLYKKRAEFIQDELRFLMLDSTKIRKNTAENFHDFRRDVIGSPFEYLAALPDSMLKEKLQNPDLSAELEFILQNHRYVELYIIKRREYELEYDRFSVNQQLQNALASGATETCIELQGIQYGLALAGKMTVNEIESIEIPLTKKNRRLLHNLAIMKYNLQPISIASLNNFRADLWQLRTLKKDDKRLNTSLAIIDYHLYARGQYSSKKVTFFDSIQRWNFVDEVQRARILLNAATIHDWSKWLKTQSLNESQYLFRKVKRYIVQARLDVDKTFEIASYYAFFWNERYALELTKSKIDDTDNPNHLIFFLKLSYALKEKLPRSTYIGYFKKIKTYSGDQFCSFFNSPALNFQLLDDEEIKAIYCAECGQID